MYKPIERKAIKKNILKEIRKGKSINEIKNKNGIPDDNTIYTWLNKDAEFKDNYVRARQDQAIFYAEKIQSVISDLKEHEPSRELTDIARLEIDTLKWTASKLLPKVYGSSLNQTNIQVNVEPVKGMTIVNDMSNIDDVEADNVD